MSKICDRNYANNAMLSVKQINGIGCCPSCEKTVNLGELSGEVE